jgi:CRISPR-associated protein Csm3
MKAGAKIRVRDSHLSSESKGFLGSTKEQPHCATQYDRNFKPQKDFNRNKNIETIRAKLRMEEIVNSCLRFDVKVDVDNADEQDIGLILLALLEFNNKRINLGGGASRGNGFADVRDINVRKKSINEGFKISEQVFDSNELIKTGKKYLKNIDSGVDAERSDFDIYYKAHSSTGVPEGHIVALMKMTTLTDFIMPGVEEETVTSGGLPVIPGSTIKGFFRH